MWLKYNVKYARNFFALRKRRDMRFDSTQVFSALEALIWGRVLLSVVNMRVRGCGVTFPMVSRGWLLALGVMVSAWSAPAWAVDCAPPLGADQALASKSGKLADPNTVTHVYQQLGNHCLWSAEQIESLTKALTKSVDDGLDPSEFHVADIRRLGKTATPEALRDRDILLTDAVIRYAKVMQSGEVDTSAIEQDTEFPTRPTFPADSLILALTQSHEALSDAVVGPKAPEYSGLKEALARYRRIHASGGWKVFPDGPNLRPGDASAVLPALNERLKATGDLADFSEARVYAGETVEAVRRFQARHGLAADGIVGPKTREALNVPVESRIRTIQLNLERWRDLGYAIPPTRFEVNVPAASAHLIVGNQSVLDMKAVVGDPKHPTPMLASKITDVILNPYWTVPPSIIENEINPILKRDPGYLERNNMHWQDGNLVQDPGGTNPLGKLRFTFANKFGVYVHDTSAPGLFANYDRARSHGCLRLEKPVDLAAALLANDPDWPPEKIEQTIAGGKTVRIPLTAPMPVVIAYWTAFTDPDGTVEFRNDVYGRDERLAAALKAIREKGGDAPHLDTDVYFAEGCGPS